MGVGHSYYCPQCKASGTIMLGTGMQGDLVRVKYREAALLGKHGEGAQRIAEKHPNGTFDCCKVIYQCECGYWETAYRGDYYDYVEKEQPDEHRLPKLFHRKKSLRMMERLYRADHACPKCGKPMRETTADTSPGLMCPKCGAALQIEQNSILWD